MQQITPLNLDDWVFIKERGALVRDGAVYSSKDGSLYLRTGQAEAIDAEADFIEDSYNREFKVPRVVARGELPKGYKYFVETSAGKKNYAMILAKEYAQYGKIRQPLYERYCTITLGFLAAQLRYSNRQKGSRNLHKNIQIDNILEENPEIPAALFEKALAKVDRRTKDIPLVLTHGDFNPFNIMEKGIIDFEQRFLAPAGYDTITGITFQRIWDHPQPDGTGTMRLWDFSQKQINGYLTRIDHLCMAADIPAISQFFDDFLMLKAVWALSYEHPAGRPASQVHRWNWRKRVALYCIDRYLAGEPIESENFYNIGLGKIK